MGRIKLTDRFIASRKKAAAGKRDRYLDALVPGLALSVTDRGGKSFVLIARYPSNPTHPSPRSLGDYGAISLEEARNKAREWLALIQRGTDPHKERERQRIAEQKRQSNTWSAVVAEYLRQRASMASYQDAKHCLEVEFAKWADRPITDITSMEAAIVVKAIVNRGVPVQARHARAWGSSLFGWAMGNQLYGIEYNPFAAIKPKQLIGPVPIRDRTLTDDELRKVWNAAPELGAPYFPLVRLLMLLGQRRNEIGEAQLTEIQATSWESNDRASVSLIIPKDRMKPGKVHVVPLVPEALGILRAMETYKGGNYIFSTTKGEKPVNGYGKIKDRLDVAIARAQEKHADPAPGKTLQVSITTQRDSRGRDVWAVAKGHAPFTKADVGRVFGVRHGDHWGYFRVNEIVGPDRAKVRILVAFASSVPSDCWLVGMDPWVLHDLRRTMRTHLSALRIPYEVRERVIGHTKKGLERTYDHWEYCEEKREALTLWAKRLLSIVNSPETTRWHLNVAPKDPPRTDEKTAAQ